MNGCVCEFLGLRAELHEKAPTGRYCHPSVSLPACLRGGMATYCVMTSVSRFGKQVTSPRRHLDHMGTPPCVTNECLRAMGSRRRADEKMASIPYRRRGSSSSFTTLVGMGRMDTMHPWEDGWKKHQKLLSNNNDAQKTTKYGMPVRSSSRIVRVLRLSPPS